MTRDDIIRMAREAGFESNSLGMTYTSGSLLDLLERFAELVAAAERNRTWSQDHWTEYELGIAAAEREACAKVCDWVAAEWKTDSKTAIECAAAIRARGQV